MSLVTLDNGNVRLYRGDCRDITPTVGTVGAMITDPVWPNAKVELAGRDDPEGLWQEAIDRITSVRVAVHLGCDTDPAMLSSMSHRWPFFRVVWLEMARPHYKGRLLYGSDVAYLYGQPPQSRKGAHVIPGRMISTSSTGKESDHPCPRKLEHVEWLVNWWSEPGEIVLDPFMGSGTTGVACIRAGRSFIGIEKDESYFDMAVKRISQEVSAKNGTLGMFAQPQEIQG